MTLSSFPVHAESSRYVPGAAPLVRKKPLTPAVAIPTCGTTQTVLLIQDVIPWDPGPGPSGNGADVDELIAQKKNWCAITSSLIGTTNLSQFREIVIAAAQTQTFYDNLFPAPARVIHSAIATWVNNGGILSANLTDCASGPGLGGGWPCGANASTSYTFVAGVRHVTAFSNNNGIGAPSHPVIADALPCPNGNCGVIVDTGTFMDLDG